MHHCYNIILYLPFCILEQSSMESRNDLISNSESTREDWNSILISRVSFNLFSYFIGRLADVTI